MGGSGRRFTRVSYSAPASITYKNNLVSGTAENLSLQGMYLRTGHEIPANIPVHVTVYHPSQSLKFDATVVRSEDHGVGLQIQRLNVRSLEQLRDIVYNHNEENTPATEETCQMFKCIY